jgi:hypothetical protein
MDVVTWGVTPTAAVGAGPWQAERARRKAKIGGMILKDFILRRSRVGL